MNAHERMQAQLRNIAWKLRVRKWYEIPAENPKNLYNSLRQAAWLRKLNWKFSTTDKSVIVSLRKSN